MKTGLFWFTQDLRLHDNPALMAANMQVDRLICVFNFDQAWCQDSSQMRKPLGKSRQDFLEQSVANLATSLAKLGQTLVITRTSHFTALNQLIDQYSPTDIFQSSQCGYYEQQTWSLLKTRYLSTLFHSTDTYTLFDKASLPFQLNDFPEGFNAFREQLIKLTPETPLRELSSLPPPPDDLTPRFESPKLVLASNHNMHFIGGETAGIKHLNSFFNSDYPSSYKQTRNSLDGWSSSCKFSPWISTGCLSVRKVFSELKKYEKQQGSNASTQWIYVELVWREYFQWFALKHQKTLFRFGGVIGKKPLNFYYGERLMKWINGQTPYPIVNACMNELAATGYISNRGRQIVASCLINELSLDWRFGAAYFEQMLIDYDVASNWGNWQYLAGVGAKNVKTKHVDLEKQSQQFDPKSNYTTKWANKNANSLLDSVDAADWPIFP